MALSPLKTQVRPEGREDSQPKGISLGDAGDRISALLDDDGKTRDDAGTHGLARDNDPDDKTRKDVDDSGLGTDLNDQNLDDDDDDSDGDAGLPPDDDDADADDGTADGDDDQADGSDEDGEAITTVRGVAEALEIPVEELMTTLTHTFNAAGTEHTLTLAELTAGYQLRADYDRDKGALADQRRNFEAETASSQENYVREHTVLAQNFLLTEQLLSARLRTPQFAQLRLDNPAEWQAQMLEAQQQLNAIQGARQGAAQQYDQFVNDQRAEFLRGEGAKLREGIPDWGDDKLKIAVDTIKTLGFNDDEVVNVVDSRLVKGALEMATLRAENDAMKKIIAKGKKAATTLKHTIPRNFKAGGKTKLAGKGIQRSNLAKLNKRLAKTGHEKDAASVIEAMMT